MSVRSPDWVAAALAVMLVIAAVMLVRQRTVAREEAHRGSSAVTQRKLEVIVDPDSSHDGAAALAMTLAVHGERATVTELVPLVNDEQGYSNALLIIRTARARGLEARGVRLEEPVALQYLHRGDILHLKRGGFVVFDEVRGQQAMIVDPTSGRVTHLVDELWQEMSGVVLLFRPEGAL